MQLFYENNYWFIRDNDSAKVIRYAIQIAEALQYIHSLTPPIINRDIKPSTILIDVNDNVKLIDFDIAVEYNPNIEDVYVLGTKGYVSPEQYTGRITPKSDRTTI